MWVTGTSREVGARWGSGSALGDRMRGNGLELNQERFRSGIRINFFTKRAAWHWDGLPGAVLESPFLGVFKKCGFVELSSMV